MNCFPFHRQYQHWQFACAAVLSALLACAASAEIVFPCPAWEKRAPEALGLNLEAIESMGQLMEQAQANGVIIRNGYLAVEWTYGGPAEKRFEVQSITKSITSLLLGIALQEGKVKSLDDPVDAYWPQFEAGPYTEEITFRHLVTATSGMATERWRDNYVDPADMKPGLESRYHNDHTAEIARTLTYLYGESLENILRDRVLKKIGADMKWGLDGKIELADGSEADVVGGFAFSRWAARDLARIGWLYLNRGDWNGERVLSQDYVEQSLTAIPQPIMEYRKAASTPRDMSKFAYGYAWRGRRNEDGRLYWYMSGNGGQFCVVMPEEQLVVVKINQIGKDFQPFVEIGKFEPYLFQMVEH